MSLYRKKPVVIKAVQWFAHGDHEVVSRYTDTVLGADGVCPQCSKSYPEHGLCPTLEGSHIVCPNDWIITGVKGEHYPCKPDIFEATYEPAASQPPVLVDEVKDKRG